MTRHATGWASLFQTAFDRSANPMALLHPNRVFVAVNQAFVDTFGYTPEQVLGRRADFLVEPRMLGQVETDWETLRRTGQITGNREFIAADGRHLRVHFAAQRADVIGEEFVLYVVLPAHPRHVQVGEGPRERQALTPREQEVREQSIGASYGGAFLAAGLVTEASIDSWNPVREVVVPDPATRDGYDESYGLYRQLYTASADVVHALAARQQH